MFRGDYRTTLMQKYIGNVYTSIDFKTLKVKVPIIFLSIAGFLLLHCDVVTAGQVYNSQIAHQPTPK